MRRTLFILPQSFSTSRSGTPVHRPCPSGVSMFRHCMAFRKWTSCFLPISSSVVKSSALPPASVSGFSSVAAAFVCGSSTNGSAVISKRQVSGVSLAAAWAAPLSECGSGVPRETSSNSASGVKNGFNAGAAVFSAVLAFAAPAAVTPSVPRRMKLRRETWAGGFMTTRSRSWTGRGSQVQMVRPEMRVNS